MLNHTPGYAEIPRTILRALTRTNMAGSDMQCVLCIMLHTYGEGIQSAPISYSSFAEQTNRPKRSVVRALNRLVGRNIVIPGEVNYGGYILSVWSINEDTSQWSKKRGDSIPLDTRRRVLARDGHRCLTCGSQEDLTIDHIIPRSRGGDNSESNLQTLCQSCNSRKGNRLPVTANPLHK